MRSFELTLIPKGEGGILEASEDFLRALRKRCDEVGALLIFDEIQVSQERRIGLSRTCGLIICLCSAESDARGRCGLTALSLSIATLTF